MIILHHNNRDAFFSEKAALSIRCYPIMGQNMGQTVLRKITENFSELSDPKNARKSPEILRFQDFLCGAYNKLIQFYSLIHCNTCQYNVAFPNTLYRSHNQIVFFPAKHTVFRTILGRFSTECGMYDKLIQFYSVIQCNTY